MKRGARVGPYEVLGSIGAGGMGEVFRARDERLGRDVAVKVLPEGMAPDPDRLRRFEMEARAAGRLQHPNLLTVFDVGTEDGAPYVVFELLEGQTLRQALGPGALGVRRSLDCGLQVVRGLAAAHERGIVHRDLKPENLFLTRDGVVKILDFGLARQVESEDGSLASTSSGITGDGAVLGTTGYMAPEQVRGQRADARSDIFSLGAVLYEMMSGRRAFDGGSAADRMTAILKEDPPPLEVTGAAAASLANVVVRCLEKVPEKRFQSAEDLGFALEAVAAGVVEPPSAASARPVRTASARRAPRRGVLLALALAGAALAGALVGRLAVRPKAASPVPVHFAFDVERSGVYASEIVASNLSTGLIALCPDGSCIVYRGSRDGVGVLYHRRLEGLASSLLPGTERGYGPFFSPDGRVMAFFADDRLKKIEIGRPVLQVVCPAPQGASGFWAPDGTILFASAQAGPIYRVPSGGGEPRALTHLDPAAGEISHRWPVLLPGSRHLLYESVDSAGHHRILAEDLTSGVRRTLVEGARYPRRTANDRLLFVKGAALEAAPIDPRSGRLTGSAVASPGQTFESMHDIGWFDVAANGTLAWLVRLLPTSSRRRLFRVDRSGEGAPIGDVRRVFAYPRLSPDGRRLAVTIREQDSLFVAVYDLARGSLTRITREGDSEGAIWTPDGAALTYRSNRGGEWNLYSEPADGSGSAERLTSGPREKWPVSWSPDGRTLSFELNDLRTGPDIRMLSPGAEPRDVPFANGPSGEWDGWFSPDGRLVAYTSVESGRLEVYVRRYPGPGGKRQVSTDGGNSPLWARSGRELFYLNGEKMMAVPIRSGPEPVAGRPTVLFEGAYDYMGQVANFDVTPDGRAFFMVRGDDEATAKGQINVVVNWFEELRRLEGR